MIERRHYPELDLVAHSVVGELDPEEFRRAVEALYEMQPVPKLSLWDLRDASLRQVTADRIRSVQARLSSRVRGREGGRTAVVVPTDLDFGVARQYLAYSDDLELPFEQNAFRTMEDAFRWLGVDGRLQADELP